MGRHYKFIPAPVIDKILELRQQGLSFVNISNETKVNANRVQQICAINGHSKLKYKPRFNSKRKFHGAVITAVPEKVKARYKSFYSPKNIITDAILHDTVINQYIRTYTRPLGLKSR